MAVISMEFSLNVFTEFVEFSDKNICHYRKRTQTCHPATSCIREKDATTVPGGHRIFKLSPIHASVIYKNSMKVLLHLGKTPLLFEIVHKI